jgi:hypothetical protein
VLKHTAILFHVHAIRQFNFGITCCNIQLCRLYELILRPEDHITYAFTPMRYMAKLSFSEPKKSDKFPPPFSYLPTLG